jgi:hypothetical protein
MLIYLTTTVRVNAQNSFIGATLADNQLIGQMTVPGAGALDQNGIRMFSDVTTINTTSGATNAGLLAVVESYNTVNSQLGNSNPGYTPTSRSTPRMSLILNIANTVNGAATVFTKDILADCNSATGFNLPNFYIGAPNGLQATRAQVEDVAVSTVNLVSHTASVVIAISYQSYVKTLSYVAPPQVPSFTIWGNGTNLPGNNAPLTDQIILIKYNVTLNAANTAIVSSVALTSNVSPNLVNQFKYIKIDMNKGNTLGELLVGGNAPNTVVGGSQVTPINLQIFPIASLQGSLPTLKTLNAYAGSYLNDVSITENGNNDIAYACYSGKNVLNPATNLYECRFAVLKADMSATGVITNPVFNQFGGENNFWYPAALSAEEVTTNGANPKHSLVIIKSNTPATIGGVQEVFYINRNTNGYSSFWIDNVPTTGANIGYSQTDCANAWLGSEGYPVWNNANATKSGEFNFYGVPRPATLGYISGTSAWRKINTNVSSSIAPIIPSIASHTGTNTANLYCPIWENTQGAIFYKQRPLANFGLKKPNAASETLPDIKTFEVYPNPALQEFNIDLPSASGTIYIISSMGNIVKTIEANSTTVTVNEPLDKGVYTIKWYDAQDNQDHFQKLSIQ